ncbi:DUF6241 domain-containing protein [Niallia sp. NCCP-28]|uniref:DUF6241 domain-containing protein n=1 Tax=Niallia sp. NCCP-28 TaxID=2934712 RepID=UPI0020802A0C|nr:DUF6241 domain-containing protein [Niallia sp. NCCP-28]GKU82031.1 hypothetical protein NCCP28_14270 [Niallia sp. NCCP-28]
MKKELIITLSTILLAASLAWGVSILPTYNPENSGNSVVSSALAKETDEQEESAGKERKNESEEQTGKIDGVTYDTKLNDQSTEDEVVQVMHQMTHQKVKAKEKWGAVPILEDTVNQVYDIIEKSDFEHKIELLDIVGKWKNNNFEEIDEDHNYFWKLQDGTIGKAYGILSEEEEEEFIKNNYKEDVVNGMLGLK